MRVWRGISFDSHSSGSKSGRRLEVSCVRTYLLRCLTRAHTLPQGPARGFSLCYCDPPLHAGGTRTYAQPRKGRSCMCSEFLLRLLLPAASLLAQRASSVDKLGGSAAGSLFHAGVHFSLSWQGTACFGVATPIVGIPLHLESTG